MQVKNIFQALPKNLSEEVFEDIINKPDLKLERIISKGQVTPEGQWYNQDQNEWVLLLKGYAELEIEGQSEAVILQAGDYLLLPAHCKHRVSYTSETEETIWLALFFD